MASMMDAASRLPAAKRQHVLEAFAILGTKGSAIARLVASNIDAEFRVSDSIWVEVFKSVCQLDLRIQDKGTADRVLNALRGVFSQCLPDLANPVNVPSRIPVGPVIPGLNAKSYGRIVAVSSLTYYWKSSALSGPKSARRVRPKLPAKVIREIILDVQSSTGLAGRLAGGLLERLPLGFYVLWSTFDEVAQDRDPFPNLPIPFVELAALLGLDSRLLFGEEKPPRSAACVLLSYSLPPSIEPRVPTVVEAYAGSGRLNYYFDVFRHQVDLAKGDLPRTLPTPEAQHRNGLPEVVHGVVFADQLVNPVKMAKFL